MVRLGGKFLCLLSHLGSLSEVSGGKRGPAQAGEKGHRESAIQLLFVNKDLGDSAQFSLEGLGLLRATFVLVTGGWAGVDCFAHESPGMLASPPPEL